MACSCSSRAGRASPGCRCCRESRPSSAPSGPRTGRRATTSAGPERERSTARRCRRRWAAPICIHRGDLRPCLRLEARRSAAVLRQRRRRGRPRGPRALARRDSWTIDAVSYGTYVAERYALAHRERVKKLVLDSVVPHIGRDRPRPRRVQGGRAASSARSCGASLRLRPRDRRQDAPRRPATARRADADEASSIRPITAAVDIPAVLRDARRGDLLPLTRTSRGRTKWERRPVVLPRPGVACQCPLQRLAVSVGLVDGSARRPQGRGRPRGRADPGEEPVPVRPGDRGGQRLHQAVPALVADAGDAARNRELRCRR